MSTFDDYAALRKAEAQASRAERELQELQEGTDAIEAGLRNPRLWAGVAGGIAAMPITGGASLAVTIASGVKMSGGVGHMVKSAMPMSVDIVAPKAGCLRIVSALGALVCVALLVGFAVCLVAYNAGVQP